MSKVFISYRRDGGIDMAGRIYDYLSNHNIEAFFDIDSMELGNFNTQIYRTIEECTHFLLVLPPHALDRCVAPDDWVRREIVKAIETNKIIIPLMMEGFEYPPNLPDDIKLISQQQGYDISSKFFDHIMQALISKIGVNAKDAVINVINNCSPQDITNAIPNKDQMSEFIYKHAIGNFVQQLIYRFKNEPIEISSLFEKDKFAILLISNLCQQRNIDFNEVMSEYDIDTFKSCVNYVNQNKDRLNFDCSNLYVYALDRISHPRSYEDKELWGGVILFTTYITVLCTVKDLS